MTDAASPSEGAVSEVEPFGAEEIAAIAEELPSYEGKVFGDGARWHTFRKRALATLASERALSERRRQWIETYHAKRVGRCSECQRVCGMGQHADAGRHADDCSVPLLTTETPNG